MLAEVAFEPIDGRARQGSGAAWLVFLSNKKIIPTKIPTALIDEGFAPSSVQLLASERPNTQS
jgi:hypothetical protein